MIMNKLIYLFILIPKTTSNIANIQSKTLNKINLIINKLLIKKKLILLVKKKFIIFIFFIKIILIYCIYKFLTKKNKISTRIVINKENIDLLHKNNKTEKNSLQEPPKKIEEFNKNINIREELNITEELICNQNYEKDIISFYWYETIQKDNIVWYITEITEKIEDENLDHENYLYFHLVENNDFIKKILQENGFIVFHENNNNICCKINKDNKLFQKIISNYKGRKIYETRIHQNGIKYFYKNGEKFSNNFNHLFLTYECILINKYFLLKQQNNQEEINKFYTFFNNFNDFLIQANEIIKNKDYKKFFQSYSEILSEEHIQEISKKFNELQFDELKISNKYYENPTDDNINEIISQITDNFILINKITLGNKGPFFQNLFDILFESYNTNSIYPFEIINYIDPFFYGNSRINLNGNNIQILQDNNSSIFYVEYYCYSFDKIQHEKRIKFFKDWFEKYYKNIVNFQIEINEIYLPS
jgi:hypothetical protein